ncbi:MAG: TonB-dependent receptor [Brevundimonas sp.]|nr:TonB-dependent receptor [Brevundimonas sp.]MDZ4062646.1 TonB-dependent receptor [Brevundimonas sp.]
MYRGVVCAGLIWSLCGPAAADPTAFAIPSQPLPQAVVAFGLQSGVSIGSGAAASCGRSRALRGRFEVEAGLTRLLSGTGCTWRRIDSRAYVIERLVRPASPVVTRPRPAPLPTVPGDQEPAVLDEVIVTATRRDITLADAPYALTAIDGAVFDQATRRDTADLASRVAGLTVTNLGPGRNKLFVRGLADSPLTGQTQAVVGQYLDDTRLTYDAPDPDLRLVDIAHAELLRGPQGTLYGAGSIGGILKLVTTPPDLTTWGAEVFAAVNATEGAGTGRSVDLVLNTPILRDRLGVRLVAYSEVVAGSIDDPALGIVNTGDTVREGARLGLAWNIRPGWDLRLGYIAQTLDSDDSQYGFSRLGGNRRALSLREPSRNDFDGLSATLSGDLGWGRLRLTTAMQSHGLDRRYDATVASGRFGGLGPTAYDESDRIDGLITESTLTSPSGGRLNWLIGAFATEYSHDRTGLITQLGPQDILYAASRRDHTDETALYGEAAWAFTDRLRVTAGARLFRLGVETEATARSQGVISDVFEGDRSDSGFAPKLVVEYDLTDAILLYAQASEGYRAGGFNTGARPGQTYGVAAGDAQPRRGFRSDELLSYEAGARIRGWDGRLSLRLAAFAIDWRNIQSDRVADDGLPFTANIGDGTNFGLEAEGVWADGPWRVDANLLLNDPEIADPDPGFPLPDDRHLPGVPDAIANLSVHRDLRLWREAGWISASVGYVGRSDLTPRVGVSAAMGGYVTSDLAAGVAFGDWSATVRLDNILGRHGDTFAYGNPFLVGIEDVETPQRPRSLSFSVSRTF